jgi:hypothetical protein
MSRVGRALTHPRALGALSYVLARVRPLRRLWLRRTHFDHRVTVACIAKDDPELTATVYEHHRRLGVPVWIVLDGKSSEATREALRATGIDYTTVENPAPYVEPMLEAVAARTRTEWLLVLNNDELLNVHSLVEISLRVAFDQADCYAIHRSWVLLGDRGPCVADSDFLGPDYQWRLVKHGLVSFHGRIHTPGYDVPPRHDRLTSGSRMYHFDWVVRSEEYRRRKVDFYAETVVPIPEIPTEPDVPRERLKLAHLYLPEDVADELRLSPLREPETDAAVSEFARFGRSG